MTLPRGFGKGWDEPDERPKRKCRLGNVCYRHSHGCSIHKWTYHHDEAWIAIRFILVFSVAVFLSVVAISAYNDYVDEQATALFENLNCSQLAEYIADVGKYYTTAEHRYEWLCVHEQIKEFQG